MSAKEAQDPATVASGDDVLYVPLDLAAELDAVDLTQDLTITVAGLRPAVQLSNGRDNGDKTWSLKPNQLQGLYLIDGDPKKRKLDLTVRVMKIDSGEGTADVLCSVQVAVDPKRDGTTEAPAGSGPAASAREAIEAELAEAFEDRLTTASAETEARVAAEYEAKLAETHQALAREHAQQVAELTAQLGAEAEARFESAKAAWQDAESKRLSATIETQRARDEQRLSVEISKLKADYEAKLATARSAWQAEERERVEKAKAEWEKGAEARLSALQAEFDDKHTRRQAESEADRESGSRRALTGSRWRWKRAAKRPMPRGAARFRSGSFR